MGIAPAGERSPQTGKGNGNRYPGQGRFVHGHIHAGTLTGDLSLVKRLHDQPVTVFTGAHVRKRNTGYIGFTFLLTRQIHQTRSGLQNRIIGGLIALRSETRNAQPDDIRLERLYGFVIDPQFFIVAGKLVGGKNVDL